jgi:hypothetical protein
VDLSGNAAAEEQKTLRHAVAEGYPDFSTQPHPPRLAGNLADRAENSQANPLRG